MITSLELFVISSKILLLFSILHIPKIVFIFYTVRLLFTSIIFHCLHGSRIFLFLCLSSFIIFIFRLFFHPISNGKLIVCSNFLLLSLNSGLEDASLFLFSISPLQQISTISLPLLSPVIVPFSTYSSRLRFQIFSSLILRLCQDPLICFISQWTVSPKPICR